MYLGTNLGLFKSVDRGITWTQLTVPKPVKKAPVKKAPARKATKSKTTAKAAPKTVTSPVSTPALPPPPIAVLTEKIKVLAATGDGKNGLFAGTDKGLYRSYDVSKGWEKLSFGAGINENVFAVHQTPQQPETIWVGTAGSGVIVSRDNGKSWQKVEGIPQDVPISSIAIDAKRPGYIYIGTSQTLYLSRDGGKTWIRRGGNLPLGNYTSILIDPRDSNEIFGSSALESDGGIYYSSDEGWSWKRVDSKDMKLPSRRVWSLAFDASDPDRIFAATHSSGVYRIDRTETASAENEVITRPRVAVNEP